MLNLTKNSEDVRPLFVFMIETTMKKVLGTYEDLASEYYDPIRHPTCANFREGSKYILRKSFEKLLSKDCWLCEVGAGKSLIAELLVKDNVALDRLIITDLSASMLTHSKQWSNVGAYILTADATNLPFASRSLEIVVSSLGDPYNTHALWKEIFRVLKPGGMFFFTTPSYEWAVSFRGTNSGEPFMLAEFELLDAKHIWVPSWIYSTDEQLEIIENEGFLVQEVVNALICDLKNGNLSPKLLSKDGSDKSIVTGYVSAKA